MKKPTSTYFPRLMTDIERDMEMAMLKKEEIEAENRILLLQIDCLIKRPQSQGVINEIARLEDAVAKNLGAISPEPTFGRYDAKTR
jgi:hypothetical protein